MADNRHENKKLREKAEERVHRGSARGIPKKLAFEERARVLHELEVYQAELEIQNEELRRAQAVLTESRGKYRDLYDDAPVGYATLDERGVIRECNRTLSDWVGVPGKQMAGRPLYVFAKEGDGDYIYRHLRRVAQSRGHETVEATLRGKGGSPRVMLLDTLWRDDGNGYGSLRTAIMDVTGQKETQEELSQLRERLYHTEKMEALGQFAGRVAHDFSNRAAAIINFAGFLTMKMEPEDPMRTYVEQILSSASEAGKLAQSLLAFGRREPTEPRAVDLNEVVCDAAKLLRGILSEDVALDTDLWEEPLALLSDPGQIEGIIMNVAANASDAMPRGGRMLIRTARVRRDDPFVRAHGGGGEGWYAVLSVLDTGTGMEEAVRERMFEPYFTTKGGRGTGLGLSIVYAAVKELGGFAHVESEPGRGTSVNVYLPLTASDPEAETHEEELAGGTETVLLAEDDAQVRASLAVLLREAGYTVLEAADGGDALRKFLTHREETGLLLLDVMLPRMNGKEIYDAVSRIRPDIKALFLSGYPADILREGKTIPVPEDRFLYKPVAPAALLKKMRQVLDAGA
jgi:two-component system cell cycle sensor histidine kinase/response regulator CckA